jgi:cytochrome P450 family 138
MTTLPPGPTTPHIVQTLFAIVVPHRGMRRLRARYGDAFTVKTPVFGRAMVISDPAEVRQLFQTKPENAENVEPNLGRVLGPGSMFAIKDETHRAQRKLLVPPFHGRRLAAMERIVEEETVRELASWPEGRPFPVLPSTMRITLNAILRAVFGADGAEFDRLRELLPELVTVGSRIVLLPMPKRDLPKWTPWGRFRALRREYDVVVNQLIDKVAKDPDLGERNDVLAMMLQSRYDDGSPMTRGEIADQLLTLLAAGHETTATTLAWAVERLRRHPKVLRDLVKEVDSGGKELRDAVITEVQRIRPVIDLVGRNIRTDGFQLGRWTVPKGMNVLVSIDLLHDDPAVFPNPRVFDPSRFMGTRPDLYQWIPFGGGTRRCIGAAFATMEMNVVLRTMLRDYTLVSTNELDERWHSRGVANAPGKGGLAIVHRRSVRADQSSAASAGVRS